MKTRKTRVVISFDDGREDNYDVFMNILQPNRIPASVYIATGFIEGKCGLGENQHTGPMSVQQIRDIDKVDIFEVGAHGNMHNNDLEDIQIGKEKLLSWLNRDIGEKIGFASPGSMMSNIFVQEHKCELAQMGLQYIRSGSNFQTQNLSTSNVLKFFRRIGRFIYKRIGGWPFYLIAYGDSFALQEKESVVYSSFPVFHETSVETLKKVIHLAIKKNKDAIFMFHSIKKSNDTDFHDLWSWNFEKMTSLCNYLCELRNNGLIEIVSLNALNGEQIC